MSKNSKHLCDRKKSQIVDNLERYRDLVREPRFVCKECGRVAGQKKWVCKPMSLDETSP